MFLLTLEFSFHSSSGLGPLVHGGLSFLVAAFLLQLTILMFEPIWLHSLFDKLIRRVIIEVWTAAFKSILLSKLILLRLLIRQIYSVEGVKRLFLCSTFGFFKGLSWWEACHSCVGLGTVVSTTCQRLVIDRPHISQIQAGRLVGIFFQLFSVVLGISNPNIVNNFVVILELLSLKVLNSNIGWGHLCDKGPLRWSPLFGFEHLFVVLFGVVLVNERWEHLVFDELANRGGESFGHWVHKLFLSLLFPLG